MNIKMTEMKIVSGKHECGSIMDMRITDVKEDEKDKNSKVMGWIIYGICKKCTMVVISNLFSQEKEPVVDLDYMVDYDMVAKEGLQD